MVFWNVMACSLTDGHKKSTFRIKDGDGRILPNPCTICQTKQYPIPKDCSTDIHCCKTFK
jgi:hypothetical protein